MAGVARGCVDARCTAAVKAGRCTAGADDEDVDSELDIEEDEVNEYGEAQYAVRLALGLL